MKSPKILFTFANIPHSSWCYVSFFPKRQRFYAKIYLVPTLIETFWSNLTVKQQRSWIWLSAGTSLLVLSTLARIINWLQVICYFMVKMQYLSWVLRHEISVSAVEITFFGFISVAISGKVKLFCLIWGIHARFGEKMGDSLQFIPSLILIPTHAWLCKVAPKTEDWSLIVVCPKKFWLTLKLCSMMMCGP